MKKRLLSSIICFGLIILFQSHQVELFAQTSTPTGVRALSGTKTIPGDYATLTAAVTAVTSAGVEGPLVLELQSGYSSAGETFPISIGSISGASATNTITIRPASGATNLSISATTTVFNLNGVDHLFIDGRPGGDGSGRELTVTNTNSSTSNSTITFINDATHNTIRNCKIQGSCRSGSSGVVFFSNGIITGNDNNTITECVISAMYPTGIPINLIYSQASEAVANSGNMLSDNSLTDFTDYGIRLYSIGNESWTISGNTISQTAGRTNALYGILFNSLGTNVISGNTIRSLNSTRNTYGIKLEKAENTMVSRNLIHLSGNGTTYSVCGIWYAGVDGLPITVTIINNNITLIPATEAAQSLWGIFDACFPSNTLNAFYNSIYIGGSTPVENSTAKTYAYYRPTSKSNTVILKNNIFFNNRTGGTAGNFSIGDQSFGGGTFTSSNNLYIGSGAVIAANFLDLGTVSTGTPKSLDEWKTARNEYASYGVQASDIDFSRLFTDVTNGDLSIRTGNLEAWFVNGKGIALTGYADDFSASTVRPTTPGVASDIGSDEFTPTGAAENPPTVAGSAVPATNTTTTYTSYGTQFGSITWGAGGSVPTSVSFKYHSGTQAPSTAPGDRAYHYYDLVPTGGSGYSYDITLFYDDGQLNGITEADLRPAKSTDGGVSWTAFMTQGTGAGEYQINTGTNTITIFGLTGFSIFTFTSQNNPLPVQLSLLSAVVTDRAVQLNWQTATEISNYGFDIERSSDKSTWSRIGFIPGSGNSNSTKNYSFTDDTTPVNGKLYYRLKQLDTDGKYEYSKILEVNLGTPAEFALNQNYPNPFNPSTTISFSVPVSGYVSLAIFNLLGEKVAEPINKIIDAGNYTVDFDATGLSSGLYFYTLKAGEYTAVKKMVLTK